VDAVTLTGALAFSGGAVVVFMVAVWVVSLRMRDTSVVDVAWGPGFVVATAVMFVLSPGDNSIRALLVLALVSTWGARLAMHIGGRKKGKGEDPRYAKWRAEHGESWPLRSLFTVFLLQAALLWVISLPLQWVAWYGGPEFGVLDWTAVLVWTVGYLIEAAADAQLAAHIERGRGGLMTSGLWSWSRHPNYFGEALLWWGFWGFALQVPGGVWLVFSPVLVTLLVRYVSGVPLLEERFEGREGWAEYAARTSVFVPMPPKG